MPDTLTIGQVARTAGVNVETIRYYQRRGLMREPGRPLNGIRRYGRSDLDRLRFIKHAQRSGFALQEVQSLLGLGGRLACRATRTIAAKKIEAIEERMKALQRL